MNNSDFAQKYPELFSEMFWKWGPITTQFSLHSEAPTDDRIGNVRIVPFIGNDVVVVKMADGNWDHPGGTLEPGENWATALEREAMEEAGARILNYKVFGRLSCVSHNPKPYRPHLPYPDFEQVVVWADVELVAEPEAPSTDSYEQIERVEVVDLDEAVSRLSRRTDGSWQAEMYELAADLRAKR